MSRAALSVFRGQKTTIKVQNVEDASFEEMLLKDNIHSVLAENCGDCHFYHFPALCD